VSERILLATRSAGKLRELRPMFASAGLEVIDLIEAGIVETADEERIEAFDTFEENARAKAEYFHARSGMPTVADDSGLAIDVLGGAPGVRSKRWSDGNLGGHAQDEANNAKLIATMRGYDHRAAGYVCAAAYVDGKRFLLARGETRGRIVLERTGAGGFGYDPYFFSDELGKTFGDASLEEKERISHRGRAFRMVIRQIEATRNEERGPRD
jgi:XTP/dITP diphosphohydrolase